MKNVLLIIAILLIIGEIGVVMFFSEIILENIKKYWWLSVLSFGRMILMSISWEFLRAGISASIKKKIMNFFVSRGFDWGPLLEVKKHFFEWFAIKKEFFSNYWEKQTKVERITILFAFVPLLVIAVGFVFYSFPATRKAGGNIARKKVAGKLFEKALQNLLRLSIVAAINKLFREKVGVLKIKIKSKLTQKGGDGRAGEIRLFEWLYFDNRLYTISYLIQKIRHKKTGQMSGFSLPPMEIFIGSIEHKPSILLM